MLRSDCVLRAQVRGGGGPGARLRGRGVGARGGGRGERGRVRPGRRGQAGEPGRGAEADALAAHRQVRHREGERRQQGHALSAGSLFSWENQFW